MARHQRKQDPDLSSATARFLDQFEELRMDLSNEQLIADAIEVHGGGHAAEVPVGVNEFQRVSAQFHPGEMPREGQTPPADASAAVAGGAGITGG